MYSSTLSLTSALVADGCSPSLSGALPRERDPVPIVQEAGWASRSVWMGAENLPQPGFVSQTIQPVSSRYTVYAILAYFTFL